MQLRRIIISPDTKITDVIKQVETELTRINDNQMWDQELNIYYPIVSNWKPTQVVSMGKVPIRYSRRTRDKLDLIRLDVDGLDKITQINKALLADKILTLRISMEPARGYLGIEYCIIHTHPNISEVSPGNFFEAREVYEDGKKTLVYQLKYDPEFEKGISS